MVLLLIISIIRLIPQEFTFNLLSNQILSHLESQITQHILYSIITLISIQIIILICAESIGFSIFTKINLSIRIQLTIQIQTSMNKNKDYTKLILNRLNSKATNSNLKSNSNSNQKTQATPTHNLPSTDPRTFFQQFEINCAVYHQPVVLKAQRKQLIRPLYFQLMQLQYRHLKKMTQQPRPSSSRSVTQPTQISEFDVEDPKKSLSKHSYQPQQKDYKPNTYKKSEDKTNKNAQSCQYINRYRSLKTIPAASGSSSIYGYSHIVSHYNSHYGANYPHSGVSTTRRVLVPQIDRRESLQQKYPKIQNRRVSPREQLMKRCQSFQKFYLSKAV